MTRTCFEVISINNCGGMEGHLGSYTYDSQIYNITQYIVRHIRKYEHDL